MSGLSMHARRRTVAARNRQRGLTTVEVAISGVAFMLILLGSIEVSRLLFTWNALDAVTQRAARIAAICPVGSDVAKRFAAFDEADGTAGIVPGLTNANIQIEYFNADLAAPDAGVQPTYVRASIVGYTHRMLVPFIPNTLLTSPTFSTTLPAESLGYVPNTDSYSC